jgi:hypothetical protein
MDLLPSIDDSSDDDDDDGSSSNGCDGTKRTYTCVEKKTETKTAGLGRNRNKIRRRGSIDIIHSSAAQHSEFFSRSIPHRRGHWSGHVKIPLLMKTPSTSSETSSYVVSLQKWKKHSVERFQKLLERRGISGTVVEHDDLYISMSKYFSLQVPQIDTFARRLADLVRQEHYMNLFVDIDEIVLMNDEKTRSFWCWNVYPNATLRRLLAHVDTVLKLYNQPIYYQPARFHVSVASFPGNILEKLAPDNNSDDDDDDDDVLDKDRKHCQNTNKNNYSSRSINTTTTTPTTTTNDSCVDKGNDEESSASSSSFDDESIVAPVHELLCTFGTTKKFIIKLRNDP